MEKQLNKIISAFYYFSEKNYDKWQRNIREDKTKEKERNKIMTKGLN